MKIIDLTFANRSSKWFLLYRLWYDRFLMDTSGWQLLNRVKFHLLCFLNYHCLHFFCRGVGALIAWTGLDTVDSSPFCRYSRHIITFTLHVHSFYQGVYIGTYHIRQASLCEWISISAVIWQLCLYALEGISWDCTSLTREDM